MSLSEKNKSSSIQTSPPQFPSIKIEHRIEIDDPVWQLGKADGDLGQHPREGAELYKAVCELYVKSYEDARQYFAKLEQDRERDYKKYFGPLGAIYITLGLVIVVAEYVIANNLVELAFTFGRVTSNWWVLVPLSLAGLSGLFKFIWDGLNKNNSIKRVQTRMSNGNEFEGPLDQFLFANVNLRFIFKAVYILTILGLLGWNFYILGVIREEVFPIFILKNVIIPDLEKEHRIKLVERKKAEANDLKKALDIKKDEVKNKESNLLKKNDARETGFILLATCFALLGGLFFSEGSQIILNNRQFCQARRSWERIQERYKGINPINPIDSSGNNGIANKIIEKYQHIYMHGYWRGFSEQNLVMHRLLKNYISLAFLNRLELGHMLNGKFSKETK